MKGVFENKYREKYLYETTFLLADSSRMAVIYFANYGIKISKETCSSNKQHGNFPSMVLFPLAMLKWSGKQL